MAIIKQYHKDTDTTYVYESISYWDPEKKQSRSKRRVIGKLDPITGEVIPTGKRGRPRKQKEASDDSHTPVPESADPTQQATIREQQITISTLQQQIAGLQEENLRLRKMIAKADRLAEKSRKLFEEVLLSDSDIE